VVADRFARALRKNATPAERVLWQQLRLLKVEGRHFRRQVSISRYVADFACYYPKLVIELDGGQHAESAAADNERSAELSKHGYKVVRFWNVDVFEALEGVVDRIRHEVHLPTAFSHTHLKDHETPTPALPTRGREDKRPPAARQEHDHG
jgi:very-short-patch-repair endonuclease